MTQVVSWTHERRSKTTFIINMTSWLARDKTFTWAMLLSGSNSKQILSAFLPIVCLPQSRAHSSYELKWNLHFGLIVPRFKKFKGNKFGNLLNFTSMPKTTYNHDSICYLITKTGSIIPVKVVVLAKPPDFHLFVHTGLPELLFSLRTD